MEGGAIVVFVLLLLSASAAPQPFEYTLSAGTNSSSVWLSESGIFAFGFYSTPEGYAICIFMVGISQRTVVWTANTLNPVLPNDVTLLIIDSYSMQLLQPKGDVYITYNDIVTSAEIIAGNAMLDNGNFVLYNRNDRVIWQSFDYPTDTLLPGQRLPVGQELFSRASERGLLRGMFRLKMQIDGNLVQYPIGTPDSADNAYYASNTIAAGNNASLNLETDGRLYLYNGYSYSYNLTNGAAWKGNQSMYIARVDPDGIFRLYNRWLDDGESDWKAVWWTTQDKCAPKGLCGVNSVCSYEEHQVNISCTCLPGFGNGERCREDSDDVGDCTRKNGSVGYRTERIANLTWEDSYEQVNGTVTEEGCERACLDDCACVVASFNNGVCLKRNAPLRYGRTSTSMALLKVSFTPPNASSGEIYYLLNRFSFLFLIACYFSFRISKWI